MPTSDYKMHIYAYFENAYLCIFGFACLCILHIFASGIFAYMSIFLDIWAYYARRLHLSYLQFEHISCIFGTAYCCMFCAYFCIS